MHVPAKASWTYCEFLQKTSAEAITYLKASNTHSDMFFGNSAMNADGTLLAVAAPWESSAATGVNGNQEHDCTTDLNCSEGSGAVYVFRKVDGQWLQEAYLKASNAGPDDRFGVGLSVNATGDVIAIGATYEDSGATGINGSQDNDDAENSGAVYIFRYVDGNWAQTAYIKASNTEAADWFGISVALNALGDQLVVGASGEDSGATGIYATGGDVAAADNSKTNAGAVYLFRLEAGEWVQDAYIKSSTSFQFGRFGQSVATNSEGGVVAAGTFSEGAAYLFQWTGTDWAQVQRLIPIDVPDYSQFGNKLDLNGDGDRLAVGMPGSSTSLPDISQGAVFIYEASEGIWNPEPAATLRTANGYPGTRLGGTLAFNDAGDRLAAGAWGDSSPSRGLDGGQASSSECIAKEDSCTSLESGAVHVFAETPEGWQAVHYLKASNPGKKAWFGGIVSMNAAGDVIAASSHDPSAANGINGDQSNDCDAAEPKNCVKWSGAVYLFE